MVKMPMSKRGQCFSINIQDQKTDMFCADTFFIECSLCGYYFSIAAVFGDELKSFLSHLFDLDQPKVFGIDITGFVCAFLVFCFLSWRTLSLFCLDFAFLVFSCFCG